jgi:CRISPR/Cas system-associated exonuclease Cas4 (RecB family)
MTMGWCIECHNTKTVDLTKSAYYEEIHNRLKNRPDAMRRILEDEKVTVRELGGWECAKCHY